MKLFDRRKGKKKTPTLPHYFSRIKMQKLHKAITRSKIDCNPDHKTTKKRGTKMGENMQKKEAEPQMEERSALKRIKIRAQDTKREKK